jgi:hypothetical protein
LFAFFAPVFPFNSAASKNWIFPATLIIWDMNGASVCGRVEKTRVKKKPARWVFWVFSFFWFF